MLVVDVVDDDGDSLVVVVGLFNCGTYLLVAMMKRYNTLLTENMDDDDVVEIRSSGALKSRYKKALQKDCAMCAGFYKTIKDASKSGKSEEDKLFDAKELFRSEIGRPS
jgi:hypothetical protein